MDELRRSELMEIYKDPSHKGKLSDPSISLQKQHIFCGDNLHLFLQIENNIIKQAKFDGEMCFVSLVSADLVLEQIIGQTIEQARSLNQEKLLALIDLNLSTSRIACATLIMKALHEALDNYSQR